MTKPHRWISDSANNGGLLCLYSGVNNKISVSVLWNTEWSFHTSMFKRKFDLTFALQVSSGCSSTSWVEVSQLEKNSFCSSLKSAVVFLTASPPPPSTVSAPNWCTKAPDSHHQALQLRLRCWHSFNPNEPPLPPLWGKDPAWPHYTDTPSPSILLNHTPHPPATVRLRYFRWCNWLSAFMW